MLLLCFELRFLICAGNETHALVLNARYHMADPGSGEGVPPGPTWAWPRLEGMTLGGSEKGTQEAHFNLRTNTEAFGALKFDRSRGQRLELSPDLEGRSCILFAQENGEFSILGTELGAQAYGPLDQPEALKTLCLCCARCCVASCCARTLRLTVMGIDT